jgi:hypothetical protein
LGSGDHRRSEAQWVRGVWQAALDTLAGALRSLGATTSV